jgi:TPR repeat protein
MHLGIFYLLGIGVDRDEKQALAWIQKAAKKHYPEAEFLIGKMHEQGMAVRCDIRKAVHWYTKAADHGFAF